MTFRRLKRSGALATFFGPALAASLLVMAIPALSAAQTPPPQADADAPLPPDAQEAMQKGLIAAGQQDYLLAIQYFEDARKTAPDSPVLYYNLGLAESKVPGRELRAIAWFLAYLADRPNAPNAAAVKDQINLLDVKSESKVRRLVALAADRKNVAIVMRDLAADRQSASARQNQAWAGTGLSYPAGAFDKADANYMCAAERNIAFVLGIEGDISSAVEMLTTNVWMDLRLNRAVI